jgi:hypothetical protein
VLPILLGSRIDNRRFEAHVIVIRRHEDEGEHRVILEPCFDLLRVGLGPGRFIESEADKGFFMPGVLQLPKQLGDRGKPRCVVSHLYGASRSPPLNRPMPGPIMIAAWDHLGVRPSNHHPMKMGGGAEGFFSEEEIPVVASVFNRIDDGRLEAQGPIAREIAQKHKRKLTPLRKSLEDLVRLFLGPPAAIETQSDEGLLLASPLQTSEQKPFGLHARIGFHRRDQRSSSGVTHRVNVSIKYSHASSVQVYRHASGKTREISKRCS